MAAKFDAYAKDYETLQANSITASGEQPGYFADYKVDCLTRLSGSNLNEPILDYGCGVGSLTHRLCTRYQQVCGFDPSAKSLARARESSSGAKFYDDMAALPRAHFGTVVLANVLHHVPPAERLPLLRHIGELLRPGHGRLVVFEHNPYNPLTRRAVSRCEFDDDAILLSPGELTRLLAEAGYCKVQRRFIVFFPKFLAPLRPIEPYMGWLPAGAQMMVVGTADFPGAPVRVK
jgi:SAM-dependent methyltransferase